MFPAVNIAIKIKRQNTYFGIRHINSIAGRSVWLRKEYDFTMTKVQFCCAKVPEVMPLYLIVLNSFCKSQ